MRNKRNRTVGDRGPTIDRPHNNPPEPVEAPIEPPLDRSIETASPPIPFEKPLDKPAMAAVLGVSVSGLDKLIAAGKAPPYFRAGRLIRWRPSVARKWIAEQEERTASEAAKAQTDPSGSGPTQ